jgi:putative salt-induced outer membrane protein YdiY
MEPHPTSTFAYRSVQWSLIPRVLGSVLVCAFTVLSCAAKQKDDVVVMKNGDRFTGEIKKLENGVLYFKAAYMVDSVQLDWARVDHVESKDQYYVFLTNGQRPKGAMESTQSPDRDSLTVLSAGGPIEASKSEVVSIVPVEDSFAAQLTGSVDYGFSFTGGTNATQSTLSADVGYRAERWTADLSGSSVFSRQNGSRNSGRNTLDFMYLKYLNERWFAGATLDLLNSQQQELDLRISAGGGLGRDLMRKATASIQLLAGAVFSNEVYVASVGSQSQKREAEAQVRLLFSKYLFKTLQFTGQAYAFPNLTTLGRVRMGVDSDLTLEIVRNLYWKVSVYENYDTHPPETTPKNDFGTSTSLGWKF